ncbi:MAG TPA: O-antigen ligase family protein [Candidatus Eisenbacteria bacterium]|nr:O-antigen ligase family protein [Candidatus Eisenbacteria bacterium]
MASTSDSRTTGLSSRGVHRPRFSAETLFVVLAVVLMNVITIKAVTQFGTVMLFAPALVLGLSFAALRILDDPVEVLCWFLFIIVNLDFLRIKETQLTADILTSSMLLYVLMVRFGLSGSFGIKGPVERTFLVYLALTFISTLLSVDVPSSIKNWGRELEYWVLFVFLSTLAVSERDRFRIARAVALSSIVPCVLGLVGLVLGIDAFYGQTTPVAGGAEVHRITGTLSHPVVFSLYLSVVAALTLSMLLTQKRSRAILLPAFLLQITVLFLTYGRTGWITFLVAVIVMLWTLGRRKILFAGLPLLLAGIVSTIPSLLARMQNAVQLGDNSLIWRVGLWIYALEKFPQRPIFGSGQDTFRHYVSYGKGFDSHHTWIGLLIETGLVGVIAFLVVMIAVGRALARRRKDPEAKRDYLVVGVHAIFIGILVSSFAGEPFDLPAVAVYFWVLLALALRSPASLRPTG